MADGAGNGDEIKANSQTGGDGNVNASEQLKKMKEELEAERKRAAGLDAKVAKLTEAEKARAEESEKQRQANLTTEEQLNELQCKLDRQDKLANYLGMGLTQEQALTVVDAQGVEKDKLIAKYSSEKAIESFKAEQLGKVNKNEPKPKDKVDTTGLSEQEKKIALGLY